MNIDNLHSSFRPGYNDCAILLLLFPRPRLAPAHVEQVSMIATGCQDTGRPRLQLALRLVTANLRPGTNIPANITINLAGCPNRKEIEGNTIVGMSGSKILPGRAAATSGLYVVQISRQ